jgi:hypothetical protein
VISLELMVYVSNVYCDDSSLAPRSLAMPMPIITKPEYSQFSHDSISHIPSA